MRKNLLVLALWLLSLTLFAVYVPFEDAQLTAQNWSHRLRENFNDHVCVTSGETIETEGVVVAHVFHLYPAGYVVISAQDYLPPIKMYSLENNFNGGGRLVEQMVFNQYKEIIRQVENRNLDPNAVFSPLNRHRFHHLLHSPETPTPIGPNDDYSASRPFPGRQRSGEAVSEVTPFIATTWSQQEPYNLLCPQWEGERSVTGCTATAVAQVMKYYNHPAEGTGSWSYETATHNISVSASFDHAYRWEAMLDAYPTADSGTPEQRDAVARLMSDVGAALSMDYSPQGSGAGFEQVMMALPSFFKYSRRITQLFRHGWTDAQWFELAKQQVDHRLPSIWAIYDQEMGHAVVIDGYRISDDGETFHLNMGWEGYWNGYYNLNNIITEDRFTNIDYQCCVINIAPADSGITFPPLEVGAVGETNRGLLLQEYICSLTWRTFSEASGNSIYHFSIFDNRTKEQTENSETLRHSGPHELITATLRFPNFNPHHSMAAVFVSRINETTGFSEWLHLMSCYLTTE